MRKLVVCASWLVLTGCSGTDPLPEGIQTGGAGGAPSAAGSAVGGGSVAGEAPLAGSSGAPTSTGGSSETGGAGGTSTAGAAGNDGGQSPGGTAGTTATAGSSSGGTGGAPPTPAACETNELARCTGTSPITCDFGGGPGDYEVTVDLGGPAASTTYVEAETYRRMLTTVQLAAGQTRRFAFGVNVRQPEGQPIQDVPAGTPGLQLYLRGSAPQLGAVCVKPLTPAPKVWVAGDSTVCDQSGTDYAGWGQHLPQHFSSPVSVANYADSGESSATVLGSAKLWGAIKAGWRAGDWVFVQVGHNDKTITPEAFRKNITAFVTQAKAANVHIVLCTPIARVGYALAAEHQSSGGANIPQIIKDVAKSESVPMIDLTTLTWNWLQTVDWKPYFALGTDRTHTNPAGAEVVAGLVRDAIRDQKLELASYLR
jgi:lysophospholipase L1-like esterase